MSTSASTHPQPQASTETPENATLSQIIRPLEPKSKLKSTAFNRVMQALTARDEAIRRETSYWKTQYEVMEKKHGEAALEKLIALDELAKCMRLLEKNQAPRAWTDQRVLIQRPVEDFNKAEKENAKLSCKSENSKVWALESEKEKAELSCKVSASESEKEKSVGGDKRRFEELNWGVSNPRHPKPVYGPPSGPSFPDVFDRQHQLGKQLEAFQMEQREFRDETRNRFDRIDESLQNLTNYFSAYPPQTKTNKGSPVIIGIYDSDDEMPSRKRGSCNDDDDGLKPIGIYDSDDEMPSRKRGSCNDDDDGLKPIGIYDSDDEMPSIKRGSCNDDDDGLKLTKKCHANSFQEVMNIPDDSDSSNQFDALRGTSVGK